MLVDADPVAAGKLRVLARGQALGTANRWLSPTVGGGHWLAVHTPHIGGVLHAYRRDGARLSAERIVDGVSNHHLGSRQLDLAAWHGQQLFIPDQSRQRMLLLDGRNRWQRVGEWPLGSTVTATASLGDKGSVAILLQDGGVALARLGA